MSFQIVHKPIEPKNVYASQLTLDRVKQISISVMWSTINLWSNITINYQINVTGTKWVRNSG